MKPNSQCIKPKLYAKRKIWYKKLNTLEIADAVIDSTRYPLHKSFIGKQVGDLVVANGRRYLIVSIIDG